MEVALHASEEAFARISATYTLSQSKDIVQLRKQLKRALHALCVAPHTTPITPKPNANWAICSTV